MKANELENNRKILIDLINSCSNICDPEVIEQSQKLDKLIVKEITGKEDINT